jgi:DNA-binding NtrC family response regulator
MEFIANSPISKKIYKLALMMREMDVNVYIYGEKGVGKTFLANFISPNAKIYNDKLVSNDIDVIVEDIQNVKNFKFDYKRVIATGNSKLYGNLKDNFTVEIELKSLKEREEDIEGFIQLFNKLAKNELYIEKNIENFNIDISENLHSLKREIYKNFLCHDYEKQEVINILKDYFKENYTSEDSYSSALKMFDKALIETLIEKYGSKLQVSKQLKINRNTLTKKVKEIEE